MGIESLYVRIKGIFFPPIYICVSLNSMSELYWNGKFMENGAGAMKHLMFRK